MNSEKRIVVLISGNGSNLQSIIDEVHNQPFPARIVAVISNKSEAFGLERAKKQGIESICIPHGDFKTRQEFDKTLQENIASFNPDLIVLAGFMRILSTSFIRFFKNKIINIHPSLLPKYPGLDTHRRALEAKDKEHGCSIHLVTEELDAGPIIAQSKLTITMNETERNLKSKVQTLEHQLYPNIVKKICSGEIHLDAL